MRSPRAWLAIAVGEALAIAFLLWLLVTEAPASASEPTGAARAPAVSGERAEPSDPVSATTAPLAASERDVPLASQTDAAVPAPAPMGTLVHGTVRFADGGKLPEWVSIRLAAPGETKPIVSCNLNRGVATFAWADVPAGDYELTARAPNAHDRTQSVSVPAGAPDVRADVVLEPSWLVDVLLLTPDGRPLHEVLREMPAVQRGPFDGAQVVALWHEIPAEIPRSDRSESPCTIAKWHPNNGLGREGGGRKLPARYAGSLEMPERRAAFLAVLLKQIVLARAPLAADQDAVELTVDPARITATFATLRVQVVDADGKPLPAANVGITEGQGWQAPQAVDQDGRLEKTGLLPGTFHLTLQCEGLAFAPCTVELHTGAVTDLGQLRMSASREVAIRIADAPADGLRGTLRALDAGLPAGAAPDEQRISVREGMVRAKLPDGRYRLRLTGAGGALVDFDTRALGGEPLVVTLQPEAKIQFDPSRLDEPAQLIVQTANGTVVLDRWITWKGKWDQLVLPGSYRVTVKPLAGAARTVAVEVPADGVPFTL